MGGVVDDHVIVKGVSSGTTPLPVAGGGRPAFRVVPGLPAGGGQMAAEKSFPGV